MINSLRSLLKRDPLEHIAMEALTALHAVRDSTVFFQDWLDDMPAGTIDQNIKNVLQEHLDQIKEHAAYI